MEDTAVLKVINSAAQGELPIRIEGGSTNIWDILRKEEAEDIPVIEPCAEEVLGLIDASSHQSDLDSMMDWDHVFQDFHGKVIRVCNKLVLNL